MLKRNREQISLENAEHDRGITGVLHDFLPTAIFAVSDEVAMGVLYAARQQGLKVPKDLSIVGVDGHDFVYLFELTTISQPVRDQGRIAARLLLEQVNSSEPRQPSVVSVGSGLIRRGTTGPVRAAAHGGSGGRLVRANGRREELTGKRPSSAGSTDDGSAE